MLGPMRQRNKDFSKKSKSKLKSQNINYFPDFVNSFPDLVNNFPYFVNSFSHDVHK